MEILILIGIFAFVVAILFRSNEALERVGVVEKEVKILENGEKEKAPEVNPGELVSKESLQAGVVTESAVVNTSTMAEQAEEQPVVVKESRFAVTPEPLPSMEQQVGAVPAPAPRVELPVEDTATGPSPLTTEPSASSVSSDSVFPSAGNVHMN